MICGISELVLNKNMPGLESIIQISDALMNACFMYVTVIFNVLADPPGSKESLTIEHKYFIVMYVTVFNMCLIGCFIKYAAKTFQTL